MPSISPTLRRSLAFVPYAGVALVHLAAIFFDSHEFITATKPMLMPALLLALLVALPSLRGGTALWGGLAIVASWLGDVALMASGSEAFLVGLAFFLVAHVFYIVLIRRRLRRRGIPFAALAYLGWLIALIALLAPHTGWLVWPLAAYGIVLGYMAGSAMSAGPAVAVGAALFLSSDTLLGINRFMPGFEFAASDLVIMLTYIAGQGLIVLGAAQWEWRGRGASPLTRSDFRSPAAESVAA